MPRKPYCPPSHQHPKHIINVESATEDIKLKILENKLVPKDLSKVEPIEELNENAYIYVDNNGTPGKMLLINIFPKDVKWENLSDDVKQRILDLEASVDDLNGKVVVLNDIAVSFQEISQSYAELSSKVDDLDKKINSKQDKLSPGENVRIDDNNVISVHLEPAYVEEVVTEQITEQLDSTIEDKLNEALNTVSFNGGNLDDE